MRERSSTRERSSARSSARSSTREAPQVLAEPVPLLVPLRRHEATPRRRSVLARTLAACCFPLRACCFPLARQNATSIARVLACFEGTGARRQISRLTLEPQRPLPRFAGEDVHKTLVASEPALRTKRTHGKVITASYLLEQLALTVLGALGIFGDAISDVYMAYSLQTDDTYAHGTLPSWLKPLYVGLTALSLGAWLGLSAVLAASYLARAEMRQHRAESAVRSVLHFLCLWLVLAFNVPWCVLERTNAPSSPIASPLIASPRIALRSSLSLLSPLL
jgi:hypothetical protein